MSPLSPKPAPGKARWEENVPSAGLDEALQLLITAGESPRPGPGQQQGAAGKSPTSALLHHHSLLTAAALQGQGPHIRQGSGMRRRELAGRGPLRPHATIPPPSLHLVPWDTRVRAEGHGPNVPSPSWPAGTQGRRRAGWGSWRPRWLLCARPPCRPYRHLPGGHELGPLQAPQLPVGSSPRTLSPLNSCTHP